MFPIPTPAPARVIVANPAPINFAATTNIICIIFLFDKQKGECSCVSSSKLFTSRNVFFVKKLNKILFPELYAAERANFPSQRWLPCTIKAWGTNTAFRQELRLSCVEKCKKSALFLNNKCLSQSYCENGYLLFKWNLV